MVYDTVQSKSLNYEAFIPILIEGMKELNQSNTQKDSVITSLNDRLTLLESMVSPMLSAKRRCKNHQPEKRRTGKYNYFKSECTESVC